MQNEKAPVNSIKAAAQRWLDPGATGTRNKANRDAWLARTLAQVPAGSRILDAGAGEQQYRRLCAHLDYVSQDFAQYDGMGDGRGLQTQAWDQSSLDIVSDITRIPEPDASFDAIMCVEVLEHVPYPVDALRELVRLLKPGGLLIVTAPFCSLTHFAPYFYQTGYSRYFYEHWLGELGCAILDLDFNGNYFEYLAQEVRRYPGVAQQYAGRGPRWYEKIAARVTLRGLTRLSAADQGSRELLSYGLHVLSRKLAPVESAR